MTVDDGIGSYEGSDKNHREHLAVPTQSSTSYAIDAPLEDMQEVIRASKKKHIRFNEVAEVNEY